MAFVRVPAVVDTADELLPAAQQLIDDETATLEADPDVVVTCKANCNACCEHAVIVTAAETRAITAAIAELAPAIQEHIAVRARQIIQRVADELADDPGDITGYAPDFAPQYYAMSEPCPLLVDGSCSVRSVRPLVCREYLMSSAPEHCYEPTLEQAVPIRRRRHVSSGFAAVSARFDASERRLLSVAVLATPEPATSKSMSGPRLARLLTVETRGPRI